MAPLNIVALPSNPISISFLYFIFFLLVVAIIRSGIRYQFIIVCIDANVYRSMRVQFLLSACRRTYLYQVTKSRFHRFLVLSFSCGANRVCAHKNICFPFCSSDVFSICWAIVLQEARRLPSSLARTQQTSLPMGHMRPNDCTLQTFASNGSPCDCSRALQ